MVVGKAPVSVKDHLPGRRAGRVLLPGAGVPLPGPVGRADRPTAGGVVGVLVRGLVGLRRVTAVGAPVLPGGAGGVGGVLTGIRVVVGGGRGARREVAVVSGTGSDAVLTGKRPVERTGGVAAGL